MISKYKSGYTTEADFCPFCTGHIESRNIEGLNTCADCGTKFYVIVEEDES